MISKIFDIEQGNPKPTVHCYVIPELKSIIETYPMCHIKALAYCFYMSCPYKSENPYADLPEEERDKILYNSYSENCFYKDDMEIIRCIEFLKGTYETMASRYLESVKVSLFKTIDFLSTIEIDSGREGNLTEVHRIQKEAGKVMESFRLLEKEAESEKADFKTKANRKLGYDELG